MEVKEITVHDLRQKAYGDGLVLQGCGGKLEEWVDGINGILSEEHILLEGSRFERALVFRREGRTNLFFPFADVRLDMGKLAVWRIAAGGKFGSMWLSDYVDHHLGGQKENSQEERLPSEKPDCPLIGQDGNIFNLMGIARRTLCENGRKEQAEEMRGRILQSGSYDEALNIIGSYVNITSVESMEEAQGEGMDMNL